MGDPAGIGPELCLRVLQAPEVQACAVPVVFGSAAVLRRVADVVGCEFTAEVVDLARWNGCDGRDPLVVDCAVLDAENLVPGQVSAECGAASAAYIRHAVEAAMAGEVAGIVTAPIHKEALSCAGVPYPGHTEMLADLTNCQNFCMMMYSDEIKVCLVTTHLALSKAVLQISSERILEVLRLGADALCHGKNVGDVRITVCGLNPHAGEHGLFGDEEERIIGPAVEQARADGYNVRGPLSPDTAFVPAVRAQTDFYVVMYHDQGLIPFKMLAFERGVNVTLGLPIVRTSAGHGTAFDIAWQGVASPLSMIEAVRTAAMLADRV